MGHEAKMAITHNFYADYYTMAGIALASCLAMCPVVGFLGRRGGLLLFMILTALASLLQLGLLNCKLELRAFIYKLHMQIRDQEILAFPLPVPDLSCDTPA